MTFFFYQIKLVSTLNDFICIFSMKTFARHVYTWHLRTELNYDGKCDIHLKSIWSIECVTRENFEICTFSMMLRCCMVSPGLRRCGERANIVNCHTGQGSRRCPPWIEWWSCQIRCQIRHNFTNVIAEMICFTERLYSAVNRSHHISLSVCWQ